MVSVRCLTASNELAVMMEPARRRECSRSRASSCACITGATRQRSSSEQSDVRSFSMTPRCLEHTRGSVRLCGAQSQVMPLLCGLELVERSGPRATVCPLGPIACATCRAYACLVEITELIWTTIRARDYRCDRDESPLNMIWTRLQLTTAVFGHLTKCMYMHTVIAWPYVSSAIARPCEGRLASSPRSTTRH